MKSLNAALGAKLARPDATVVAIVGDGAFVFGVPTSACGSGHSTLFETMVRTETDLSPWSRRAMRAQ